MAAAKDTGQPGLLTCLCPSCGRMACDHRPERDTAPGFGAVLTQILHAIGARQAGMEAGS